MTNEQKDAYINGLVKAYNEKLPTLDNKLRLEGYNVHFVDTNARVKKATDIYDGCHPNEQGSANIASAFAKAISEYYTQNSKVVDITLSAANNWTAAYDISSADTATEYYVDESNVPEGWKVSYDGQFQKMGSATPITVTNKRVIPKTSL
jgi:hypothetical protein